MPLQHPPQRSQALVKDLVMICPFTNDIKMKFTTARNNVLRYPRRVHPGPMLDEAQAPKSEQQVKLYVLWMRSCQPCGNCELSLAAVCKNKCLVFDPILTMLVVELLVSQGCMA